MRPSRLILHNLSKPRLHSPWHSLYNNLPMLLSLLQYITSQARHPSPWHNLLRHSLSSNRRHGLLRHILGSVDVESDDTIFTQTKARLPWLLIGMLGGLGNSLILGNFESGFAADPTLALFIPLIGGTGGNVGTQSSAIVVQGLANGSMDIKNSFSQLLKELGVGLINGCIISLMVFIYNFFKLGGTQVTTVAVSLSLLAVVLFASVFGTFVPLTLERLKIDPALATGPFISITNDIIGMIIYMSISTALLTSLA